MKKIILILSIFWGLQLNLIAQSFDGNAGSSPWNRFKSYFGNNDGTDENSNGESEDLGPKNVIKINLASLAVNNYSVQYERVVSQKISIALGGRYMPETRLPLSSNFKELIKSADSTAANSILNTTLGNFAITPELRFYLSKKAGKGFYLAAFGRYEQWQLRMPLFTTLNSGRLVATVLEGSRIGGGVGAMMGVQFSLGSRITLDLWLSGAYIGPQTYKLTATSTNFNLSTSDITELKDVFAVSNFLFDVNAEISNTKISLSSTNSLSPSVRSGLCLGFRF